MLIAIPVFRLSCKVGVDKARGWSVVEEMVLWGVNRSPMSIAELAKGTNLPRQLIVAALARLMRFRLVELGVSGDGARFRTSGFGKDVVESGRSLPFFPKREVRRVSCVIERATGGFFAAAQVRIASDHALRQDPDPDIRRLVVEGGGPSMSHDANLARLSNIAARGWEEQLAYVDARTSSVHSENMLVRVVDGVPRNLPDGTSQTLRDMIDAIARRPAGARIIAVEYAGRQDDVEEVPRPRRCTFASEDVVIGVSEQRELLLKLLKAASRRVIIHSTFLDHNRFRAILPEIRAACARGVSFDLLWGADSPDEEDDRNAAQAVRIAAIVREDRELARRFRIHMRSTRSHAKLIMIDLANGAWTAAVGSCNWLSTPFSSVETTVVLRDPHVVADVATALQRLVGRRGLSDDIATEMKIVSRELGRLPPGEGDAEVAIVLGDRHDELMRDATGGAATRVFVGCHRLGSTARPGVVLQAEAAVRRAAVNVTLLYTRTSGPLRKKHATKLASDAEANGVRLVRASTLALHGKYVAWDDDDLIVTSLNWASAASDADFPHGEIGVHVRARGVAALARERIEDLFPESRPGAADGDE